MVEFWQNGEIITKETMKEEDWYADWQAFLEIKCMGPHRDNPKMSFWEKEPDGLNLLLQRCEEYYKEFPGPVDQGWKAPSRERLEMWAKNCWMSDGLIRMLQEVENKDQGK